MTRFKKHMRDNWDYLMSRKHNGIFYDVDHFKWYMEKCFPSWDDERRIAHYLGKDFRSVFDIRIGQVLRSRYVNKAPSLTA